MTSFSAEARKALSEALSESQDPPPCPECGAVLSVSDVPPQRQVAYVRRRVWVLCPSCRRTGAVDVREGGRP